MALIVQKYGGTSVGSTERISVVADRVVQTASEGNSVVVVVSAMGDTTDELLAMAQKITPLPNARGLDVKVMPSSSSGPGKGRLAEIM